jgi:hypothetical protein
MLLETQLETASSRGQSPAVQVIDKSPLRRILCVLKDQVHGLETYVQLM